MYKRDTSTHAAVLTQYADSSKLAARIHLHVTYATNPKIFSVWVFEQLVKHAPRQANVLEVGSGRGDLWRENDHAIPADWHVTLTDVSAGMVEDCRMFVGTKLARRFDFNTENVEALRFGADTFDVVIANHVLYHAEDIATALAEVRRVTKPGGRFFAMTNGKGHLHQLQDLQAKHGLVPQSVAATNLWDHSFSLENGHDLLRAHFNTVEYLPFDDTLHVTDAQAIVDYISSLFVETTPAPERLQALYDDVTAHIQRDGAFIIEKATGLFIAS